MYNFVFASINIVLKTHSSAQINHHKIVIAMIMYYVYNVNSCFYFLEYLN